MDKKLLLLAVFIFAVCQFFTQSAFASINQEFAKKQCGTYSTEIPVVVNALKNAKLALLVNGDPSKIIHCGALALSLNNNAADKAAAEAFVFFYNNVDDDGKIFLLGLMNSVAFDAALMRESNALGLYFSLFVQEKFDILDAASKKRYSDTVWSLASIWTSSEEMATFAYYLMGQAYYRGQAVDQDFDAAFTAFQRAVDSAHGDSSVLGISMSRAKYCWFAIGLLRANSIFIVKNGILECLNVLKEPTSELGAIKQAVDTFVIANMTIGNIAAEKFWVRVKSQLEQQNMTVGKANKYFLEQCRTEKFCEPDYLFRSLVESTSVYEANFASASLLERVGVQSSLAKAGYYSGEIDGLWGSLTSSAIRRYSQVTNNASFRVDAMNKELLQSYPVKTDAINSAVAKIYQKIKGKSRSNYEKNFVPQRSNNASDTLNLQPQRPRTTSIYYNGSFISCTTMNFSTVCN